MTVKAYAKLNLTLDVLGVSEGYHMLDSLVAAVDVFDTVTLRARGDGEIRVHTQGADIPERENHAFRAAKLFQERFSTRGADIFIEKRIPIGAGMGGSSADSAAVIAGMGRLFSVYDACACKALCDETGSDTGFLFTGGLARLQGRGERVTRLPFRKLFFAVLPTQPVSTAACFAAYDEAGGPHSHRTQAAAPLLAAGDIAGAAQHFGNDLAASAGRFADVGGALARMRALSPLGVGMTGSGGAVFGLFESRAEAHAAVKKLGPSQAFPAESIEYNMEEG